MKRGFFLFFACFPMISAAAPERRPNYEPAGIFQAAGQTNLFFRAKTTASGQFGGQAPDAAVNGKKTPADHWACENLPVWHQIDLGEMKSLGALRVWPYWGDGRIYQYVVEGSADGKSWEMLGDHSANSIAATAEGDGFSFAPREVRYVRTTFRRNSLGEKNGGHLVEIEGYAKPAEAGLAGGFVSSDVRVPTTGEVQMDPAKTGMTLKGWKGERVNAQLFVTSAVSHTNLRLKTFPLGGERKIPIDAKFIRYTLVNGKPEGDIIDPAENLPLAGGSNRPVWVSVDIPADAKPGKYQGGVIARTDQGELKFPITLEVANAAIPAPGDWKFHLDLWQHPEAVARWHDVPAWSEEHFTLMEPLMKRLAAAGQKTITVSLVNEPWGGQTYDAFPAMIGWTKKQDGSWEYDYSVFDRWVTFMSERVGMKNARIHCYTMIPWSLKFRYFDESVNAFKEAALKPGTPGYDEYWGRFLRDFTAHLKAKGWFERTLIGIDERPDELLRGALGTLRKHAPGLEVASAINHPSALTREFADISPIINHSGDLEKDMEFRAKSGKTTTYYVCTSPERPNTFTFSPPAESEWLGVFAYARQFDGFLRWAFNSWVENPFESTDFVTWPSGDCFLVYPGNRSSIRFERLRDGIETYEKLRVLEKRAEQGGAARASFEEIRKILADFTWERGRKPGGHAHDVRRINEAIENAVAK